MTERSCSIPPVPAVPVAARLAQADPGRPLSFPQDDAAGRYDGGVLEELEAHQFFHPQSVRWYRSLFSDRNLDEGRDLGDVEFLHDRGWVVECGDGLAPTRAAVLVFGRARYVRRALPRPVIDCQFIGAGYDQGPPERHWTDQLLIAWLVS